MQPARRLTLKAFTLIELMVVVLIIGLLIAILLPSLGAAMESGKRLQCAANLSGFGKSFKLYAQKFNDAFPATGVGLKTDGVTPSVPDSVDTQGSLWLMVTTGFSAPEAFVCPSDKGATAFKGTASTDPSTTPFPEVNGNGIIATGGGHRCWSYSYQVPNCDTGNPAKSNPNATKFAIMADRGPFNNGSSTNGLTLWSNGPAASGNVAGSTVKDSNTANTYLNGLQPAQRQLFNSPNHQGDGQNVMFQDGHVKFMPNPCCGINDDNIYTRATAAVPNTGAGSSGGSGGSGGSSSVIDLSMRAVGSLPVATGTGMASGSGSSGGSSGATNPPALPFDDDDSVLLNVNYGKIVTGTTGSY